MTCTLVTMFFDLTILKDNSAGTRPVDFYLRHAPAVLCVKSPMVIFCDDHVLEKVRDIRVKESDDSPTIYVVKSIIEYDIYKLNRDTIDHNRGHKQATTKSTPSYFIIMMFKFQAILMAKQANHFNTTHYAWIDLGCKQVVRDVEKYAPIMLENPKPKVSICYIHYRSHTELYPPGALEGNQTGIAAGVFTVEKTYVDRLYNLCMCTFHNMLYSKHGLSDETVLTYAYDKDPDIFNLYYGDYYSLLSNYHEPLEDHLCIVRHFIINTWKSGNRHLSMDAARKLQPYLKVPVLIETVKAILS